MGEHIIDGEFQSDKYPTCPRGKVPLSTKDPTAQPFLWGYAQVRRAVDPEFADDLETVLLAKGFKPVEDVPGGALLEAGTLYISALKYLIQGYRSNDGGERIMAICDSVNVQEKRWNKAVDRLKGEGKTDG